MNSKHDYSDFITIRPITERDYEAVVKWSKNADFCRANDWELNRDEQELYKWWLHCVNDLPEDVIRMGIELDNQLIGYADLACIAGNTAELGVAIGESALWGKGIGFTSSRRMMEYASSEYGITIFSAETHETNSRARKMLDRLGFTEVSRNGSEEYAGVETTLIQYVLSS